jgi:hypothetical protein
VELSSFYCLALLLALLLALPLAQAIKVSYVVDKNPEDIIKFGSQIELLEIKLYHAEPNKFKFYKSIIYIWCLF